MPHALTIFFDLDGTLLDTAQDMIATLNALRQQQQLDILPYAALRGHVSNGSAAMIKAGFDLTPEDAAFPVLQKQFLALYKDNIATHTRLFPGMAQVIDTLDSQQIQWGIVTNKPSFLTEPLLTALDLTPRCACIISGDTLAQRKPHPEPLLHACRLVGGVPEHCLYVGDAERDIESGRRAGMTTMAACYGYLGDTDHPEDWRADYMIQHPLEILHWLQQQQAQPAV